MFNKGLISWASFSSADKVEDEILVSILMNAKSTYNNVSVDTNMIKSAYGRNHYKHFYQELKKQNAILYEKKE